MKQTEEVKTLADTVHRCLMCNELAFEYEKDKYKCSDPDNCDFKWTVIHCE